VFLGDGRVVDKTREIKEYGGNHHEKLGQKRISVASRFTIYDTAGTSPNPGWNTTDRRSSPTYDHGLKNYGDTLELWWVFRGGRGKNCVTKRRRRWEIQRMRQGVGGIIQYVKEVVWGIATSDDVAWLYWYQLCWWRVRSWDNIRMVQLSMRNGSRVVEELYIKIILLLLEDFHFLSLYSFSCTAKQAMTLKQLRLLPGLDFLNMNFEHCSVLFPISHSCYDYHLRPTWAVILGRVLL